MKSYAFKLLLGFVGLSLCLLPSALAQELSLTVLPPQNAVMGGVYTSPYTINVNGVPELLICDDFTTDITLGEQWPTSTTSMSTVDSSAVTDLKFNQSPGNSSIMGGPNDVVYDYAVAAVLAADLMEIPNIGTSNENAQEAEAAGEISYAIWGIFDQTLWNSLLANGSTGYGSLTTSGPNSVPSTSQYYMQGQVGGAEYYLALAESLVNATNPTTNSSGVVTSVDLNDISVNGHPIESLLVYTPVVPPGPNAQEFLQVSVPEPSSRGLLALDLLAAAGLIVALRRRISLG